ncbi:MAG: hypothetical protein JWN98_296 [Abditibacteriota bacterium]|nr:hypothetical protein [Abditibacteriota bacterium]
MNSTPCFIRTGKVLCCKVLCCAPALILTGAIAHAEETAPPAASATPSSTPSPAPAAPSEAASTTPQRAAKVPLSQRLQNFRGERTPHAESLPLRNTHRKAASLQPAPNFLPAVTHESLIGGTTLSNLWRFRSERHTDERAARWSRGERVAESWKLGVDAPVEHPWGTLKVSANFEGGGGGLASDAASAIAADRRGGAVALQQDVKVGAISGSTKIAVSQTVNRNSSVPVLANAPGAQNQAAEGSANLRWQMKPGLALTTSHQSRLDRRSDWNADPAAINRNLATRNQSEVGLEWRPSKTYSVSLGAGQTRMGTDARRDGANVPTSLRDEERTTLNLQRRTGAGAWGVRYSRQSWEENVRNSDNREADSVSLHGERKLLPWLSLRGSWRLSGEDNYLSSRLNEQAQREAEAQIQSRLGQFALRYADSSQHQSTLDGATLGESGAREYGLRYNVGAASGVGFSMEYSVRAERAGENRSNYRLGVTYR